MLDLPLEYALIGFEGDKFSGEIVPELLDLAKRGIVRFVDIVFIQKEEDGSTRTFELNDLDTELYEVFVPMGEHVSSLFTTDDLAIAASKLPANSAAHAPLVGESVGRRSPQGYRGCRRPTGGARPDRARSGRAVRAGAGRGIAKAVRSASGIDF